MLETPRSTAILTLSLLGIFFLYFTIWIIGVPFVEEQHLHHFNRLFAAVEIGLILPAAVGTFTSVFLFSKAIFLVRQDRLEDKRE